MTDLTDNIMLIEGWLRVCDNFHPCNLHTGRGSTSHQPMQPEWILVYCVLNRKTNKFHHFSSIESAEEYQKQTNTSIPTSQRLKIGSDNVHKDSRVTSALGSGQRLNSSTKSFTLDNKGSSPNFPNSDICYQGQGQKGYRDDRYEGSNTSINSEDAILKPSANQSKFSNFFNRKSKQVRNLKRTKSASKLDKKKDTEIPNSGLPDKNQLSRNIWQNNVTIHLNNDFPESNLKRSASLGRLSKRFFSRTNIGQKSFDKKDKIISSSEKTSYPVPQLRPSHSSETLLSPQISVNGKNLSNLDLLTNSGFTARSLHFSLSNESCFIINKPVTPFQPIINGNGVESGRVISEQRVLSTDFNEGDVDWNQMVICYACKNDEEKCLWLKWLWIFKDCNDRCRIHNSLKLFILEAKNLPPKKKYFCEISLNRQLFAQTTVKQMTDILFWGEQFSFNDLSRVDKVEISIFREAERKKKKEKHFYLGTLSIPTIDISTRQLNERWYPATIANPSRSSLQRPVSGISGKVSETIMIRVKARFQSVNILPKYIYQPLLDCFKMNYGTIVEVLEPLVTVKTKEELATCLVSLLHNTGDVNKFLSDVVMSEVERLENDTLALRGNSIATKAIESYMVLIGQQYLITTLQNILWSIITSGIDFEVDPSKVQSNSTLSNNRLSLIQNCQTVWYKICNSSNSFPIELKKLFMTIRENCTAKFNQSSVKLNSKNQSKLVRWDQLVSSCVFLRFFCPAILSPSLFNIVHSYPDERGARNLTLIAKTIQSLANFTKFGGKEAFMLFMNDFVLREFSEMTKFLESISTVNSSQLSTFRLENDLGRELSILHSLLVELIKDMNENQKSKISQVILATQEITKYLNNPSLLNQVQAVYSYQDSRIPLSSHNFNNTLVQDSQFISLNVNQSDNSSEIQKCKHNSPSIINGLHRYQSTENFISTVNMANCTEYMSKNDSAEKIKINKLKSALNYNQQNINNVNSSLDTYNTSNVTHKSDIFMDFDQLDVDEKWKRILECAELSKNSANLPLVDFSNPGKFNKDNESNVYGLIEKSSFATPISDIGRSNNEIEKFKTVQNLNWKKINIDPNCNFRGSCAVTPHINKSLNNYELRKVDVNKNYNAEMFQHNKMPKKEYRNQNSAYERLMKIQKASSVESLETPLHQKIQNNQIVYPCTPFYSNLYPRLRLLPISNSLQKTGSGSNLMIQSEFTGWNFDPINGKLSNTMSQSTIFSHGIKETNKNTSSPQFSSLPPTNSKLYFKANNEKSNRNVYNSMQNIDIQIYESKTNTPISKPPVYEEQLMNNPRHFLYTNNIRRSSSPSLAYQLTKSQSSYSQPTLSLKPVQLLNKDSQIHNENPLVSSQSIFYKENRSIDIAQPIKEGDEKINLKNGALEMTAFKSTSC